MPKPQRAFTIIGLVSAVLAAPPVARAQAPQISSGGVSNAAVAKTVLARGGLASVYGSNFAAPGATFQAGAVPFPLNLGGVSVTVGGVLAPLYFVSSGQINFQTPFEVPAGSSANVVVTVNGSASPAVSVAVSDYALGIFGYFRTASAFDPIALHLDNSFVTPNSPAQPGETLVLYATGIGKLNNAPASGAVASGSPLITAVDTPTATVGGSPAKVLFAGLTPGAVGLAQIDITLPSSLATGSLPLAIQFPGDTSVTVSLAVQGNVQAEPQLSLPTNSLAFGSVTTGQTKDLPLVVNNTGSAPLNVSSLNISGSGFSVVAPTAPFTVAAGGVTAVTVRFSPSGAAGASGALSIVSNDANSPALVSLSGTGVAPGVPAIGVSVSSLDFGTVTTGQTKDLTLSINNTGSAPLTVSSLTASAGFSVVTPSTPFTLAAGATAVVTIRFAPTVGNSATGTLTIASTDPANPSVSVSLKGVGAITVPLVCGFTLGPDIYAKWTALGGQNGVLGCPTASETEAPKSPQGTTGRTATFANGLIYWHRDGVFAGLAYEMHGCVVGAYTNANLSMGLYGFPVSDQYTVDSGYRNDFQGGYIVGINGLNSCSSFPAGLDFTGSWTSDRGFLTMLQDSLNVTGTYGGTAGTVSGSISGNSVSLSWQDGSGQGLASFTLAADGKSFMGTYAKQGAGANSQWNGTRAAGGSAIFFTPSRIDFGAVTAHQSKTLNVVATAAADSPVSIMQFSSDNPAFQVNIGGFAIQAGASTTLPIRFTPATSGAVSATLTITTSDPARPTATIKLTGTGQ